MNSYFLLYLWTRLDALKCLLAVTMVVSILIIVIALMAYTFNTPRHYDSEFEKLDRDITRTYCKRFMKICFIILITSISLNVFVPSKKDVAIIYLVPNIYKSEGIQDSIEILNKLPKQISEYIKDYVDIKESKK